MQSLAASAPTALAHAPARGPRAILATQRPLRCVVFGLSLFSRLRHSRHGLLFTTQPGVFSQKGVGGPSGSRCACGAPLLAQGQKRGSWAPAPEAQPWQCTQRVCGTQYGGAWPGQTGQLLELVWWLEGQAAQGSDTQRRRMRAPPSARDESHRCGGSNRAYRAASPALACALRCQSQSGYVKRSAVAPTRAAKVESSRASVQQCSVTMCGLYQHTA
jgi:hypothetical protein